jgi:sugar phosphate isomerase/epimerase
MTSRGIVRGLVAAALAACVSLGAAGTATAASPECAGHGVPVNKISIQLWTFAEYIGFGTDAATIARTEEVFRRLSEMGYRNVEPFTLSGLSAEQYRALLDRYGLKASARHVNVGTPQAPVDFQQILDENRVLGIQYFGSGATPDYTTEAEWIAYAQYLDRLGAMARQQGQTLMVHNHFWEFERVFGDQTAFDILMANTDPRNVVFQVDLYWATRGGADPVELLER